MIGRIGSSFLITLFSLSYFSMLFSVKKFGSKSPRFIRKIISLQDRSTSSYFSSTFDTLITGLNQYQDISVKVVSCKGVIQEAINRNEFSLQAAKSLGEVMICGLMIGSGLKGEESLQINLVGNKGLKSIMSISDGDLKIRGMVGNPGYSLPSGEITSQTQDLLGDGQVQVVRNHPAWKSPMNGIVALQNTDISMNIALYMAQSEQRSAAMLTDVVIAEDNKCVHAIGVLVECLPGATEENIEKSIKNLEYVQSLGLARYLIADDLLATKRAVAEDDLYLIKPESSSPIMDDEMSHEDRLHAILDDCLVGMGEGIRWSRDPKFQCTCGVDRVWRALALLPADEISEIVDEGKDVELKCGFCGKAYSVGTQEIGAKLLSDKK